MKKEYKRKIFFPMLKNFETEMVKAYFMDMAEEIPDYIFVMPGSTSGKYHNRTQCGKFGQIYHVYMFAAIVNYRLALKGNRLKYPDAVLRDCMRCTAVFHDALKCGVNGSAYTVHEHPVLAGEWVRNTAPAHDIPPEYKELTARMCERHSGEWTSDKRSKTVLPEPETDAELFIHECDILASRADLDMEIPEGLTRLLEEAESVFSKRPEVRLEDYVIPFGKFKGRRLLEIAVEAPWYIRWCKENIEKEPMRTLLKQL